LPNETDVGIVLYAIARLLNIEMPFWGFASLFVMAYFATRTLKASFKKKPAPKVQGYPLRLWFQWATDQGMPMSEEKIIYTKRLLSDSEIAERKKNWIHDFAEKRGLREAHNQLRLADIDKEW